MSRTNFIPDIFTFSLFYSFFLIMLYGLEILLDLVRDLSDERDCSSARYGPVKREDVCEI